MTFPHRKVKDYYLKMGGLLLPAEDAKKEKPLSVRFVSDRLKKRGDDLIRVLERHGGMGLSNLFLEVRFLFGGQDHELYACPIAVTARFAPDEHAVLLAADLFFETDQTGLDPLARFYPDTDNADIHDPDNVFRQHGLVEGDDVQGVTAM
jgi:hypothetical protein